MNLVMMMKMVLMMNFSKPKTSGFLLTIFRSYLPCEDAREGESEGASEVLVHETVDDRVGGGIHVYHVLGNRHQRVVVLCRKTKEWSDCFHRC